MSHWLTAEVEQYRPFLHLVLASVKHRSFYTHYDLFSI